MPHEVNFLILYLAVKRNDSKIRNAKVLHYRIKKYCHKFGRE